MLWWGVMKGNVWLCIVILDDIGWKAIVWHEVGLCCSLCYDDILCKEMYDYA